MNFQTGNKTINSNSINMVFDYTMNIFNNYHWGNRINFYIEDYKGTNFFPIAHKAVPLNLENALKTIRRLQEHSK